MRRIATALSLGVLASMWSVWSTMGTQSWKIKAHYYQAIMSSFIKNMSSAFRRTNFKGDDLKHNREVTCSGFYFMSYDL